MSSGAKEVLIKSVAQGMGMTQLIWRPLTWAMGISNLASHMLLAKLCEAMTQLIWRFWWAEDGDKRKVHWTAWDKLTMPKGFGGMGFQRPKVV
jgi:hypothetical protein